MEDKYLKNIDSAGVEDLKRIYIVIYNDFVKYLISLDDFSWYCGQLHKRYRNITTIHNRDEFEDVLVAGDELDHYVREPGDYQTLIHFLQTIHSWSSKKHN